MNLSNCDSDDDSIAGLMAKHEKAHQKKYHHSEDDDDDSDDASDDSPEPWESSRRNKRQRLLKVQQPPKKSFDLSIDLDDISDDDDDDEVQVMVVAKPNAAHAAAAAPKDNLVESSDEEDDEFPSSSNHHAGHCSLYDLRHQKGMDKNMLEQLEKSQLAKASLRRAQNTSGKAEAEFDSYQQEILEQQQEFQQQYQHWQLQIHPRWDDDDDDGGSLSENKSNNNNNSATITKQLPKTIYVNVLNNQTVQNVIDSFLKLANLSSEKNTVGLKFKGHLLDPKRVLSKISSLQSNSHLEAELHRSSIAGAALLLRQKKQNNGENNNNNKAAHLGKTITIKLRNKHDKKDPGVPMTIREKESFLELVEPYRLKKKLPASQKIILELDGEDLGANHTPKSMDVEEDDIIEVKIR